MLLIYPSLKDFDELIKEFAVVTEDENMEKVVSERRKDLYLDDENASRPFLSSSLSTFPRSSFQAGYEAGPTASTIRVRTSTSSSICPRATQQQPYYSLCLAGFRFAPLVYLFAYLFLGPLTLVYFSHPLLLSPTLSPSLTM